MHSFLSRALASAGYAGIEIRVTPVRTEIRIKAAKATEVVGERGRKIRELTSMVQKRFGYPQDAVELNVEQLNIKSLSASIQAENCKYKLLNKVPVRLAANSIIKTVMRDARGCEVQISGKLR